MSQEFRPKLREWDRYNRATWRGHRALPVPEAAVEHMRRLLLEDLAERCDPEVVEVCRRFIDGETPLGGRVTHDDLWEWG